MNLWRRLRDSGSEARRTTVHDDEPIASLEAAYRAHLVALDRARRGVASVLTAEKRLEIEANALLRTAERAAAAARAAAARGDDDAARLALEREVFAAAQRERILEQAAAIEQRRVALETAVERLRMRADLVRTERLALGAHLAVARAVADAPVVE